MEHLRIRAANEADSATIAQMVTAFQDDLATSDTHGLVHSFQSAADAERYVAQMWIDVKEKEGVLLLAEDSAGAVVGLVSGIVIRRPGDEDVYFATTHEPAIQGWIGVLFVCPEQRGQGVATLLVTAITQHFLAKRCQSVHLLVANDNQAAVKLYQHVGMAAHTVEMAMPLPVPPAVGEEDP